MVPGNAPPPWAKPIRSLGNDVPDPLLFHRPGNHQDRIIHLTDFLPKRLEIFLGEAQGGHRQLLHKDRDFLFRRLPIGND